MRSEPLLIALSLSVALAACDEKSEGPAPERFASVKKKPTAAASTFCEKTWGPNEKKFVAAKVDGTPPAASGWRWVNLWATWCKPCVEEMGLLLKWNEAFEREQAKVTFDLLSIDEPDADLDAWRKKNLPGQITRIKSQEDFAAFLETLGVDKNAAIPIHVLVDPAGSVRCVRVGSIHQENYGAVRALVAGGQVWPFAGRAGGTSTCKVTCLDGGCTVSCDGDSSCECTGAGCTLSCVGGMPRECGGKTICARGPGCPDAG